MFASHALSLALLVIVHAPYISARGGRFGGGDIQIGLDLGSVDSATFSFYIIFAVLTILQALQALGALGKRRAEEDFRRRVPFILLTFFGIISQTATYSLDALLQSQTNEVTLTSLNFVVADTMLSFVHALTHVFLYSALLLLLDYRSTIQALQYQHSKSKIFVIALRVVSAILLLLMFVCTLARAILGTTQSMAYYYGQQPPLAARAYEALDHLFVGCYIITTAAICGASLVLWLNKLDSQHDWVLFDTNVGTLSSPVRLSLSNMLLGPCPHCTNHMPHYCHPSCL
jgi:hypothetical protein